MIETRRLKNIVIFSNCYKFCAVQKNYYLSYIGFFSVHANLFAQKCKILIAAAYCNLTMFPV